MIGAAQPPAAQYEEPHSGVPRAGVGNVFRGATVLLRTVFWGAPQLTPGRIRPNSSGCPASACRATYAVSGSASDRIF